MSSKKHRNKSNKKVASIKQPLKRHRYAIVLVCAITFLTLFALSGINKPKVNTQQPVTPARWSTKYKDSDSNFSIGHLGETTPKYILSKTIDEVRNMDIGEMNLWCAQGLPGSENLDIPRCLGTLDEWAKRVESETKRNLHRFYDNRKAFENSEAFFRAAMIITVLQQDLNVHYNPERIHDWTDDFYRNSKDTFIHGMLGGNNTGTCASMPVLYVAIGRRLGYPMKLVSTKSHLFARWEDDKTQFNIEGTNQGMTSYSNDYYKKWPFELTKEEINSGCFLKSATPDDELAIFLSNRAETLRVIGHYDEAIEVLKQSLVLVKNNPEILIELAGNRALKRDLEMTRDQMMQVESLKLLISNLYIDAENSLHDQPSLVSPVKKEIFDECITLLDRGGWTEAHKKAAIDFQHEIIKEQNRVMEAKLEEEGRAQLERAIPIDPNQNMPYRNDYRHQVAKTRMQLADEKRQQDRARIDKVFKDAHLHDSLRDLTAVRDNIRNLSQSAYLREQMQAAIPNSEGTSIKE